MSSRSFSEARIIFLLAAVQFVNTLDFMMVMPLGPDLARNLGISAAHLGYIGGSYTLAAGIAALLGAGLLDRFNRRYALAWCLIGLATATALGGFAWNFASLLAARLMAGACGGPAAALAVAIIGDVIPATRRGKAMGIVMSAFSITAVIGVPIGLELAQFDTWRLPFFVTAGLGLAINMLAILWLPNLRDHMSGAAANLSFFNRIKTLFSLETGFAALAGFLVAFSGFMIAPNMAGHIQLNMDYPRAHLTWLYMAGGVTTLASLRLAGIGIDRFGSATVIAVGTACYMAILGVFFIAPSPVIPVIALFAGFMLANSTRNVAIATHASKIPPPHQRAGFMSMLGAIQHLAAALGSGLSSLYLFDLPGEKLGGVETVGWISMALAVPVPVFLFASERLYRARIHRETENAPPTGGQVAGRFASPD